MPDIGRPNFGKKNQFSNIGIRKTSGNPQNKRAVGESLNDLAGIKEDSQFVDRSKHNKLGKDGFLKLLANQLQNQDPLNPMDQKQFAADMAQFAQLEQMTNMNSKLDGMGQNAPTENKFYGASFLGKEVMTTGSSVDFDGMSSTNLPFFLSKPAKQLLIRVYDKKNQLVAQIKKENIGSGGQAIAWDGISTDGTRAQKDNYRFSVQGWDDTFSEFKGETQAKGIVTGVRFEGGETILRVDGRKDVFLRDVASFNLPKSAKQAPDGTKQDKSAAGQKIPALQKNASSAYNNIGNQTN